MAIKCSAYASVAAAIAFPALAAPNAFVAPNGEQGDTVRFSAAQAPSGSAATDAPQITVIARTLRENEAARFADHPAQVQIPIDDPADQPASGVKFGEVRYDYGPTGFSDDVSTVGFAREF